MKRHVRCRAAERAAAEPAKVDPFAPENKVAYNDGWLDRIFMKLFTSKIADQLEPGTFSVPNDTQYEDFVRVSKEILRGRSTQEQHALVRRVLLSLVPPGVPAACKVLFRPTQWAAEVNAAVASWGFFWLVGDSELRSQGVEVAPGVLREQKSVVHIKKCRYLEASGCVGLCVNMCKVPTQSFFTNDFGMPLTMNPNFEDLSCEMVFGQVPPLLEQDPVYTQSCFVPHCSLADRIEPCPKTDTERVKARQQQQQQQQPAVTAAAVGAGSSSSSSNGSGGSQG
uniref:Beta-carotene isomerase D27-like C-terminal domain-containing protein n=1 Tax=Tetradesmus obliquus TaxID=3088 RepID=A0A383VCL9_TETOB|eukprot:jgi/Sobl393_1/7241/SZX77463.1